MFLTFEFYLRVVDIRKYSRGSQIFIQKKTVSMFLSSKSKYHAEKSKIHKMEVFKHIIKKLIRLFLRQEIFSNENLFVFFPDLLIRSFL